MDIPKPFVQSPTAFTSDTSFQGQNQGYTASPAAQLYHSGPDPARTQETSQQNTTAPVRRRRASKADMGLKRSASTPNVRSTNDNQNSMLNDKKRNKLGYHRTSVACVHCRRRKIRCLLAPDDSQGRCANCIRLKKECQFYPVDQQPPQERKPRTGSKAETKSSTNSSSTSSSPGIAASTSADLSDQYTQYSNTPTQSTGFVLGINPGDSATFSPPGSAAYSNTSFDFAGQPHPWDRAQQYHPNEHSYGHDEPRRGFWQPGTPISSAYSYPTIPSNDPMRSGHEGSIPGVFGIPQAHSNVHPMRSMSYSQIETLQHQHDPHHMGYPHDPERRPTNASEMPPPSLRHSVSSSVVSMNDAISGSYNPVSAPISQSATPSYAWTSSAAGQPSQGAKPMDLGTGAWHYSEQQHQQQPLAKVQEEHEGQMRYVQEPGVLYSHMPHQ